MVKKKILTRLFSSEARVKILGYLFFNNKESYIREISRKLKLYPSAVKREIDNLVGIGIIEKENNKIILNQDNNIIIDLKNLFLKTDFIIYPIKEALNNKKIEFAFVFGSFARGEYREDSDVDLMIVGNINQEYVFNLLRNAEEKIKREINPVVWTIENLKKERNSGFVKDIFKKGIIMIKGDENELRKIIE